MRLLAKTMVLHARVESIQSLNVLNKNNYYMLHIKLLHVTLVTKSQKRLCPEAISVW